MNEHLLAGARAFASRDNLEIGEALGSGKDGIVVAAKNKQVLLLARSIASQYFAFKLADSYEYDPG